LVQRSADAPVALLVVALMGMPAFGGTCRGATRADRLNLLITDNSLIAPVHFDSSIPRTDVVNLAVGLKASLTGYAVAFAGALVPLTSDGLRADVVPTGGVEYTF